MVKRSFEEISSTEEVTTPNPGDKLWDLALDSQDKAVRSLNNTIALKHYRNAREYAISCHNKYIELGEASTDPREREQYFEYAYLANEQLVNPFKKMVKSLKSKISASENKKPAKIITRNLPSISVSIPSSSNAMHTYSSGFFANTSPSSLINLCSLKTYNSLDEISCISGTDLEKIELLVKRFSAIVRSKILATDSPCNETKLATARELLEISYDCIEKILAWARPYSSQENYQQIAMEILDLAKNSAKCSRTIYMLSDYSKVSQAQLHIKNIGTIEHELQNQKSEVLLST